MLILHISVVPSQQVLVGTFPSPPKLGIAVKAGIDGRGVEAGDESVMGPDGGGLGLNVESVMGPDGGGLGLNVESGLNIGLGLNVESAPGNEQARLWQRDVLVAVLEDIH